MDSPARPLGGLRPEPCRTAAVPTDDGPRSGLPVGSRLGDRRGLTSAGAVGLALLLGAAGGAVEHRHRAGAAQRVRGLLRPGLRDGRRDRPSRAPADRGRDAAAGLRRAGLRRDRVEQSGDAGSFVSRQALELANSLFLGAPVLLTATALALAVALARGITRAARPGSGGKGAAERPAG